MARREKGLESDTGKANNFGGPSRNDAWKIFDRIAHRYDLLNHLLSAGLDFGWRRRVADHLSGNTGQYILDIATGTADLLITLCGNRNTVKKAAGLDMSFRMLSIGRKKVLKKNLEKVISFLHGDAMHIPVVDNVFDAVTIAFGIRNVIDVNVSLKEMFRVLKPGGRAIILEFSIPRNRVFRPVYMFYFRHLLPILGSLISGDRHAYRYLNESVETFPYGESFSEIFALAGFRNIRAEPLAAGIATIYRGEKP